MMDEYHLVKNGVQSEELHLCFRDEDYAEKLKELQFHLDTVKEIVRPGCSPEVLNVALASLASLNKMLSQMSCRRYPLASL